MENKKAFTLVEIIIYLAIFALVFVMIIEFAIFLRQANSSANNSIKIDNASIFTTQVFDTILNNLVSIDTNQSIFNNNNGRVNGLLSNGENIVFQINNQRIQLTRNGVNNFITPLNVRATNLNFQPIYGIDTSNNIIIGVELEFTLEIQQDGQPLQTRTVTTNYFLINV